MPLRAVLILSISLVACLISLRKPFWGLCFFALINYIRPERFSYNYLADFRIPLASSICILVGWLLQQKEFRSPVRKSRTLIWLFGVASILLLSSCYAEYSTSLSFEWAEVLLKVAVYCFFMVRLIDTKEKLAWFIGINLFGAAFLGIWGFQQHFLGNPRLENMAGGQFGESNSVASLWVLTLPLFVALLFQKGARFKIIGGFLSPILLSSIVFTQSRAALLGLAVATLFLFLFANMRLRIGMVIAAILMYGIFIWAVRGTPGYQDRIDSMFNAGESGGRLEIWDAGLHMFSEHPLLGVGAQNFQYLAKEYFLELNKDVFFKQRADAHNTFLLFLCEGGIFTLLFYLLAIFSSFKDIHFLCRKSKTEDILFKYRPFVLSLAAGLLGFITCSMFHSYPVYETFYWFLMIPSIARNIYHLDFSGEAVPSRKDAGDQPCPVPAI